MAKKVAVVVKGNPFAKGAKGKGKGKEKDEEMDDKKKGGKKGFILFKKKK